MDVKLRQIKIALALMCLWTSAAQAQRLVDASLPIADPNIHDQAAHQIWRLRAGLNVAALQCQFSPFLATVSLYNNIIRQHDAELKSAYQRLNKIFLRARQNAAAFDRYNTRTYNGFSTLDAQEQFCDTAASIGREALRQPVGSFSHFAATALPRLQNSLNPTAGWQPPVDRNYLVLPEISKCKARKPCPRG